jgi:hypothetical protein
MCINETVQKHSNYKYTHTYYQNTHTFQNPHVHTSAHYKSYHEATQFSYVRKYMVGIANSLLTVHIGYCTAIRSRPVPMNVVCCLDVH